jgi:hypothetical protein
MFGWMMGAAVKKAPLSLEVMGIFCIVMVL